MLKVCSGLAAAGIVAVTSTWASAGEYVANPGPGHTSVMIQRVEDHNSNAYIVTRSIVAPAAVVSRDIAQQPVYSGMIEYSLNGRVTFLDPYETLHHPDEHRGLDENHSVRKAQRLYLGLNTDGPARLVYGGMRPGATMDGKVIRPMIIIDKRDLPRQMMPNDNPAPDNAIPKKVALSRTRLTAAE